MNTFEMLREVGFAALGQGSPAFEKFERLVELVRDDYSNKHAQLWLKRIDEAVKAEREACAKVCEESASYCNHPFHREALESGAFAIRARNKE
jgi:hypothetical protein